MQNQEADEPVQTSKTADLLFIRVPHVLMGSLLFAAIAINFANVIARYFFFHALYWAEEAIVFITMWGVMLAGASITYQGLHIKMDLFSSMLRSPVKEIVGALTALLMIGGTGYALVQSWKVVEMFMTSGELSVTAGIPMTIPHLAIPIGFGLMALAVVIRLRSYITGRFE